MSDTWRAMSRLCVSLVLIVAAGGATIVHAQAAEQTFSFEAGKTCWRFEGVAGRFSGELTRGDKVIVTATGEKSHTKGDRTWATTGERDVEVDTPDASLDLDLASDGGLTAPKTGRYTFSIDPLSDAASPGVFIICRR